jgi:hypothetical protein
MDKIPNREPELSSTNRDPQTENSESENITQPDVITEPTSHSISKSRVAFIVLALLLIPSFLISGKLLLEFAPIIFSTGLKSYNLPSFIPAIITALGTISYWLVLYKWWYAIWSKILLILLAVISIVTGCEILYLWLVFEVFSF